MPLKPEADELVAKLRAIPIETMLPRAILDCERLCPKEWMHTRALLREAYEAIPGNDPMGSS